MASLAAALLGHGALLAALLLLTTRSPAPEAEATTWFALGLPGPGGGNNLFAAPGNPGEGGPGADAPAWGPAPMTRTRTSNLRISSSRTGRIGRT